MRDEDTGAPAKQAVRATRSSTPAASQKRLACLGGEKGRGRSGKQDRGGVVGEQQRTRRTAAAFGQFEHLPVAAMQPVKGAQRDAVFLFSHRQTPSLQAGFRRFQAVRRALKSGFPAHTRGKAPLVPTL